MIYLWKWWCCSSQIRKRWGSGGDITWFNMTGWWFGTFSHLLGIIIPTDYIYNIFQRGWSHQPDDITTIFQGAINQLTNITNITGGHHGAPQIHMAVVAAGAWRGARAVGAPEFCGDVGRRDEAAEKQDGRDGIAAPWGKWWELTNESKWVLSGKHTKNYGKSQFCLMGKPHYQWPCLIAVSHSQRVK